MLLNPYRFGGGGGGGTDPYWSQVRSLLHFDGADGSTVMTDQKGGVWTATGATLSTADAKFGSASLLLTGANRINANLGAEVPAGTALSMEFWIKRTSADTRGGLLSNNTAVTAKRIYAEIQPSETLQIFYTSGFYVTTGTLLSTSVWKHVAFVRAADGSVRLFYDGVFVANGTGNYAGALSMDAWQLGYVFNQVANARIDDFRVTQADRSINTGGVWSYPLPTGPLPDS